MKKLLLLFVLLSFSIIQTACAKANLDSLWGIWEDPKQHDTTKFDALAKMTIQLLYNDPQRRNEILDLMEGVINTNNLPKRESQLNNFRGQTFLVTGNYDSALFYFNKSLAILVQLDNEKAQAQLENNIGLVKMYKGDYDGALLSFKSSLKKKQTAKNFKEIPSTIMNIGMVHHQRGEHEQALHNYMQAYFLEDSLGDAMGAYTSLYHAGAVYNDMGNYPRAKEYMLRCIPVAEKGGNIQLLSFAVDMLGAIAFAQEEYDDAERYFLRSRTLAEEQGNEYALALSGNNIGDLYLKIGELEKAEKTYVDGLEIAERIGEKSIQAMIFTNLGSLYAMQKEYKKAEEYMRKGLKIDAEMEDFYAESMGLHSLGTMYLEMGQVNKSIDHCNRAYRLAKKDVALPVEKSACDCLYKAYKRAGNIAQSFKYLERLAELKDTLNNEDRAKEMTSLQLNYEHQKRIATDSIQNAEAQKVKDARIEVQEVKLAKEKNQRYALFGGLALVSIFSGLMYNRFRVTRKQKQVIEVQKEEVEAKNHEILESINYAKKLQTAVLPPAKVVKEFFANSFLLYLPKDIVSGDFYWMENMGDTSYFAVADCTGHGVPGAMLSIIGLNGLNRALHEQKLKAPKEVLTSLSETVTRHFEKSDATVRDGMDICLCALNNKTKKLTFSGANNPLWIARDNEMLILKGDRRAIGHDDLKQEFTQQEIQLQDGDTVYLASDGYQDQLGGKKYLKMMTKVFRTRLLMLSAKSMEEQRSTLISDLDAWKGKHGQTDDVCVMGIRI